MKTAAVILSGGSGKRMGAGCPKQYMDLCGYPLIYYSVKAFEDSFIDEIVLVCAAGDEEMCRSDIVQRYGFKKIKSIVCGGAQRYHSVMCGVKAVSASADYIFIHDGARPFIDAAVLKRALNDVCEKKACVVGMPVKDTIKIASADGYVDQTPARTLVWQVQTPQVFAADLIRAAYAQLEEREEELLAKGIEITDDAMIVELLMKQKVYLTAGSYENIKITTPEDMEYARWMIEERRKKR